MPHTTMMFSRRRMESVKSTSSITPADELTSWLPDDVCVTCHVQVKAGQLYCSQECREEDAKTSEVAEKTKSSRRPSSSQSLSGMMEASSVTATPLSSSEAKPTRISSNDAISSSSTTNNNNRIRTGSFNNHQSENKFRYPCPPSPNILAKYGSHLTSPALAALDHHKSSQLQQTVKSEREFLSSSSEEDSTNGGTNVQQTKSNRRSSSRSTFSSVSEAAFSTDPSTPSPAVRSTAVDDEDDLEPTDLNLPPSVYPVTVNAIRDRRSPAQKKINLPSNPPIVKRERVTMMSFARRPSRTNLPAPVLFTSPVLATTVMKASPQMKESNIHHHHHQTGTTPPSSSRLSRRDSDHARGPYSMDKIDERSKKPMSPSMRAVPVNKQQGTNAQIVRKSPSSPPQIASASSSAGKTLRAFSPSSNIASTSFVASVMSNTTTTVDTGFVCGRYGCKGLSGSIEQALSPKSIPEKENGQNELISNRRSMLFGHKHTHSASAGLSLMGQAVAEDRKTFTNNNDVVKLQMTSMSNDTTDEGEEEFERSIKSPARGRSKARGRSSTSRRSPSPPRGAARRGRSEDMLSSKDYSLHSQPLKVPVVVEQKGAIVSNLDEADDVDADDEKEERRGRRGRSPTERGRSGIVTKASAGADMAHINLGRMRIEEANEKAKEAPSPLDTPGSVSEISVSDSTGYDEVDMDEL